MATSDLTRAAGYHVDSHGSDRLQASLQPTRHRGWPSKGAWTTTGGPGVGNAYVGLNTTLEVGLLNRLVAGHRLS